MESIRGFVRCLAAAAPGKRSFNQYASGDAMAVRKRANLRLYLSTMAAVGTKTVLIGEAPSYRGGRLTGIPFLSETLMLEGAPGSDLFGTARGYVRATRLPRLSTEASATIVWGTIGGMRPPPLLWNAFPFHPFQEGKPDSNRAPARAEIAVGQPFLEALLRLFAIETVVAVGNHASASLSELDIPHTRVRHPSNGGKKMFVDGVLRICQNRNR
jgi:uracil-DNA glycosylase